MDLTVLDVVLVVGAAIRLTRLAVVDRIADPIRGHLIGLADRIHPTVGRWAADLVGCPHCVGFWITGAVVGSWLAAGHTTVWQAAASILTVSYVVGHAVAHLDTEDSS